ncbi:MAG: PocR ligand-binding domain-containing protein [Ardenticatenaceae bacterium]|nr:PocR ligand-binding domain-containing protein [Ardenticatenaceae bacterium]MCB8991984.1 PocR ligand-binding domain-containing protein [Ardenticatenaceae bacterium]MCB9004923.1 PocR ligand-binding domain-containing protein [Ardenticatenaceae bacterium]
MDDLLTTKQVQDLLQVDRTTVYRMLKDGRITGVKVGQQWRFHRQEVENLLGISTSQPTAPAPPAAPLEVLPLNCVQSVQDVCAEIAEIGAVTTDNQGLPLTQISNCGQFCAHILASKSGRQACEDSWRKLAQQSEDAPRFVTCHAGLQYARASIKLNGNNSAMIIAGQFYTIPPNRITRDQEVRQLAETHQIDGDQLVETSHQLIYLDDRKRSEITRWLNKVARAFEQIGRERADLMRRLKNIAAMSTLGD